MTPFRERRLTTQDGLSLYFRDYGDPLSPRLPLLCLAGLVRNSADFGVDSSQGFDHFPRLPRRGETLGDLY